MNQGGEADERTDGVLVVSVRGKETTQNATFELLQVISELTWTALVTTALSTDSPIRDEFEVIEISTRGTGRTLIETAVRFLANQFRMTRAITRRDEQTVLFFGATAYVIPILVSRFLGKIVVLEPRGDVPLTLKLRWQQELPWWMASLAATVVRALERTGFRSATAVITYTPGMAETLDLEAYSHKLHTKGVRHVDIDQFRPTVQYSERDERIGFVGRLDVEKGMSTIEAVIDLIPDDIAFLFVGDGPYRSVLEDRLASEIESGRVEFTGWIPHDEVATQLNRMRLLVMPSEPTEGLPSTILESMACGTPVLATPVSGIPDVITHGETGFIMESTDPHQIAAQIEQILSDRDLHTMSENCRNRAVSTYSFDSTVDRYRQMLAEISAIPNRDTT